MTQKFHRRNGLGINSRIES